MLDELKLLLSLYHSVAISLQEVLSEWRPHVINGNTSYFMVGQQFTLVALQMPLQALAACLSLGLAKTVWPLYLQSSLAISPANLDSLIAQLCNKAPTLTSFVG